jgi:hypothetical protein
VRRRAGTDVGLIMLGSPGKDQPGWHLAAQLTLLHSMQVDLPEPHGRFESLDAMQAAPDEWRRTYSTDRPCPPRHRTALAATRTADPGGEDGRRAAAGDQHGDAEQRHAERSSSAARQPVRAASEPNHVKEWSELRAAWLH